MTQHLSRAVFPSRLVAVALLAGGVVGLTAGCDRDDATSQAVKQAARDVNVIGGGGGPAATVMFENKQYAEVIAKLTPVVEKGLDEEQAAALVILAQSHMGLAAEPAGIAAGHERECLDRMSVIRSLLGDWLNSNARAAALEQFDPSESLAQLGTSMAEKDKLIADQSKAKAALDAKIAELQSQSAAKMSEAQAQENTYAQLKERASKLSAVEAEPIVKEAAQHKRLSDEARNAGALIDARAEQVIRQSREAGLLIDQYTHQRENFEATGKSLRDRLSVAKTEAGAARAEAAKTAARMDTLLVELRTLRAGPTVEAAEKALKSYQAGVSNAKKAVKGDQNGGSQLTVGAAQQAIGDLQWSRAQGFGAYAQLLETLAKAEPALPRAGEYAKEAAEANASRKECLDAAKAAYEAAQNAYGAVRSKAGEAKDRLEQLSKSLEALAKVAGGEAKDLAAAMKSAAPAATDAAAAPPPAESAAATSPAPGLPEGVPAELAATIETVLGTMRTGKQSDAVAIMYFTPETASLKAPLTQMAGAADKLDAACRAKFGIGLAQAMSKAGGAGAMSMGGVGGASLTPEQAAALQLADLQITVNGDNASVGVPGGGAPLEFVKSEGKWLLDPGFSKQPPAALAAISTMGPAMSKAISELAADVESGKVASAEALAPALMQKMTAAMSGGPGGG